MNIVHILSSLSKINFGIWNAAVFGSEYLKATYKFRSIALICSEPVSIPAEMPLSVHFLGTKASYDNAISILEALQINEINTIVVSHGCWLMPTKIGYGFKKNGYHWIYTPHGMLEAWGMKHRRIKKFLYWNLFEKRMAKEADLIRAVSKNEKGNLEKMFSKPVVLVENGVKTAIRTEKPNDEIIFLFMARLHIKKGIIPLVKAWNAVMTDAGKMTLIIAGPDEGEFKNIRPYLRENLEYIGSVYGNEKRNLLNKAHYYVLPSFSEGFPTSVLEAMSFGLIPIITEGCNFPEVFQHNLGFKINPDEQSIVSMLTELKGKIVDESLSKRNSDFISAHYSEEKISEDLHAMYNKLLP